ncbi:MAG: protein kinase [Melioribacteraceae bacterium]|nr:protein kinase [Melioribacteraceae bacterium]
MILDKNDRFDHIFSILIKCTKFLICLQIFLYSLTNKFTINDGHMDDLVGKKLENYKIVSILGRGGMGVVYKAYDTSLERNVAIKMLSSQLFSKERFVERFKREAKNQAKLSHPNIVTVYGFIEYHGLLGIVMEYIDGESLEKLIYRQGRIHLYDAVYVMKQILAGIGYAHAKGFIHRDIKPSNIIFNAEGVAKIMDFGISKSLFEKSFTKTGAKIGTIYYMSPEQIRGDELTHHTDIYSLGCAFYEMLTGQPPFDHESEYNVMDAHLKTPPPKVSASIPGLPENIDKIITTALQKNQNERYQTCEDFIADLRDLDKYIAALQEKYTSRIKPNPKKTKIYSITAFTIFVIALAALVVFAYYQVDSLLKSRSLEKLKKYNVETLFEEDEDIGIKLSQLKWLETNNNNKLNSIFFANNNLGIAVGDSVTVLLTENAGDDWNKIILNDSVNLNDAFISENGKAVLVGNNSKIIYTEDKFIRSTSMQIAGDYTLFKVTFSDPQNGFIVGSKGSLVRSYDGGKNWEKIALNTNDLLYDIIFVSDKIGFICGWNGTILKATDGGNNWKQIENFTNKYLRDIDFLNEDKGIVVGGGDEIFLTFNGGESWESVPVKQRGGLQSAKFITDNFLIMPGNRGELIISKDSGDSWSLLDTKTYMSFTGIEKTINGNIFITAVNGRILRIQ